MGAERFSVRIGARAAPKLGLEEATPNLRTACWNRVHARLFPDDFQKRQVIVRVLWNFVHWPTDNLPTYASDALAKFKKYWDGCEWPEFYDVLQVCAMVTANLLPTSNKREEWLNEFNELLRYEGCGYTFVAGRLVQITSPTEVAEVRAAAGSAVPAVGQHIIAALDFLAARPTADARNAIKEAISAVESALKVATAEEAKDLAKALPIYERKFGALHGAMRDGLMKLYAYTSDEKGISLL